MKYAVFTILLLIATQLSFATTIHVPSEQPTIEAGINAAVDGDTVLVAVGTYVGEGNRDIDFLGKAIIVRSEGGNPETCSVDCDRNGRAFYFGTGEDSNSALEGFTIVNGDAKYGAAVFCDESSPRIVNCVFRNNYAYPYGYGGAINCSYLAAPTIIRCVFSNNKAQTKGGGIYAFHASPTIRNCVFTGNYAENGGGICGFNADVIADSCTFSSNTASRGGAGLCLINSSGEIKNCRFSDNYAYGGDGGGLWLDSSSPPVIDCEFVDNRAADWGGGTCCQEESSPEISNCLYVGNTAESGGGIGLVQNCNPNISGCAFFRNAADTCGGAVYCLLGSAPKLTSCSLVENQAVRGGGISCISSSEVEVYQTIIAFSPRGGAMSFNISFALLWCCDLYGNVGGDWTGVIADQEVAHYNFSADPLFCDRSAGNLFLHPTSPCASSVNYVADIGAYGIGCESSAANGEIASPPHFSLLQNFPNPFNLSTCIVYEIPRPANVELAIYNITGRQVVGLVSGIKASGLHRVFWDGKNETGHPCASGVYFCKLLSCSYTTVRKILLLK